MASIFWFADGGGTDRETPPVLVRWIRTQSPVADRLRRRRVQEGHGSRVRAVLRSVRPQRGRHVRGRRQSRLGHATPARRSRIGSRSATSASGVDSRRRSRSSRSTRPSAAAPATSTSRTSTTGGWCSWTRVPATTRTGRSAIRSGRGGCAASSRNAGPRQDRVRASQPAEPRQARRQRHGRALWDCLFDDSGAPLAALTVGGHDHNVTWYDPRPKVDPDRHVVPIERGIFVHVNGAGGHGHDETSGTFTGFFSRSAAPRPQFADDDNWCVTRIDLIGPRAADVSILSFGTNDPPTVTTPALLKKFELRL